MRHVLAAATAKKSAPYYLGLPMSNQMRGRRALVTGGTRGLGAAISAALSEVGFDVVLTSRTELSAERARFECHAIDFTDMDATSAFADKLAEMDIDVLVNNAGINLTAPFAAIVTADFKAVQNVNLFAPMVLSRAVLQHMRDKRWGRIVNLASIFAEVSREGRGSYSASKFGLVGLTKALAAEVARDGILVNCVSPGVIDTELTRAVLGTDGIAKIQAEIPIGRLGQPKEVAALVRFLASDDNSYISGQSIVIDGGFTSV